MFYLSLVIYNIRYRIISILLLRFKDTVFSRCQFLRFQFYHPAFVWLWPWFYTMLQSLWENFLQCKAHTYQGHYLAPRPQFCLKTSVWVFSGKKLPEKKLMKTVNLMMYLKHTCWKATSQIKTILLKEHFRECSSNRRDILILPNCHLYFKGCYSFTKKMIFFHANLLNNFC